jgi:hypothetical protein
MTTRAPSRAGLCTIVAIAAMGASAGCGQLAGAFIEVVWILALVKFSLLVLVSFLLSIVVIAHARAGGASRWSVVCAAVALGWHLLWGLSVIPDGAWRRGLLEPLTALFFALSTVPALALCLAGRALLRGRRGQTAPLVAVGIYLVTLGAFLVWGWR